MEKPYSALKDLHQKNENPTDQSHNNSIKFEIVVLVMAKNHTCHTLESKYLLDNKVLKIPNDSTHLFITLNGKERKTNINGIKPYITTELIKNVLDSFLSSIKPNTKIATITKDLSPHLKYEQYNHL